MVEEVLGECLKPWRGSSWFCYNTWNCSIYYYLVYV